MNINLPLCPVGCLLGCTAAQWWWKKKGLGLKNRPQHQHIIDKLSSCWWSDPGETRGHIGGWGTRDTAVVYEEWNSWVPEDLRHKERIHLCMCLCVGVRVRQWLSIPFICWQEGWSFCMHTELWFKLVSAYRNMKLLNKTGLGTADQFIPPMTPHTDLNPGLSLFWKGQQTFLIFHNWKLSENPAFYFPRTTVELLSGERCHRSALQAAGVVAGGSSLGIAWLSILLQQVSQPQQLAVTV